MASSKDEGIRILKPLVCDALPGAPPNLPATQDGPISYAEFDAHHEAMTASELLQRFYALLHEWRTGRAGQKVLRGLTSIRKILQKRGKDPGPCEEHGDGEQYGRW